MLDTFVHLHVASGYSMQYGASTPAALVERAAAWGQPALALTDRDGLYGAVRFVQACTEAGVAPILGVDLAVRVPSGRPRRPEGGSGRWGRTGGPVDWSERGLWTGLEGAAGTRATGGAGAVPGWGERSGRVPPPASRTTSRRSAAPRTPVRGGAAVDARWPRVTVLARGRRLGLEPGVGWARLCRLVTRTHLAGERGEPVTTPELLLDHAAPPGWAPGDGRDAGGGRVAGSGPGRRSGAGPADLGPSPLVVLLGPDSDVGRAALVRRRDLAREALDRWRALLPPDALAIEVVCHGGPEGTPANLGHAARMLALAHEQGVRVVLTAAVRHADPDEAATVDVLDAARRLVALDVRHLDRVTTGGHLSPTPAMLAIACDVVQASGPGLAGGTAQVREGARGLLASTVDLALECVLDPALDLGIGGVHLPEPHILGLRPHEDPQAVLAERCRAAVGACYPGGTASELDAVRTRLDDELGVIGGLGYPTYFLTVATVVDLVKEMGVRIAARGSGAGSLVNYLLGVSGVDPMRYGLLMERFCSPLRAQLPDIDVDVESARRTEIYERVLERFGGDRVTCVSMMDSYRVRHAIRDVGAALGMAPAEVDAMAKAFPHISARNVRHAIADLPELRASGFDAPRLQLMLDLVERLDGLPRHIALHPCGVILSDSGLLDRTPVEASFIGFPMSQFDKDDVEALGLLKLDVLGIRMQSAMAHAVEQVRLVDGADVDLDDRAQVPLDDEATFRMIRTTHTLGCFQIESPGQRELIGKFGPESFEDIVTDISLFRPGPVKSDMIVPFLNARQGWAQPEFLHPTLIPALRETEGVVVFHEQVLLIVAETTGVTLAEADEVRRAMGSPQGQAQVLAWWRPAALARGYSTDVADRIWEVLKAFASFGFCKAHAAAFALPTYQSAWLKTHHPAAFLAGVLTHDPGMYPKRLILDDARSLGITVLGLDVNASDGQYVVERLDEGDEDDDDNAGDDGDGGDGDGEGGAGPGARSGGRRGPRAPENPDLPDGSAYGIRLSLADVKGISAAEIERIVAGRPYATLADFWRRARVSRPVAERLVLAGAFDSLYGIGAATRRTRRPRISPFPAATSADGSPGPEAGPGAGPVPEAADDLVAAVPSATGPGRRGRVTRRDLLLHVAELDRWSRAAANGRGGTSRSRVAAATSASRTVVSSRVPDGTDPRADPHTDPRPAPRAGVRSGPGDRPPASGEAPDPGPPGSRTAVADALRIARGGRPSRAGTGRESAGWDDVDVARLAASQSRSARPAVPADRQAAQLTLDLGDTPRLERGTGLPEMTGPERVRAELDILGLDASAHVVDFYAPMLDALGVTRSRDLLGARSRSEVWIAGVKVATQTPPVRSGRRVVFLTLDDATGPSDATFFEDVQGPYAGTVFHSWMLLVRGVVRRTGPRGVSVRATGAWELSALWEAWTRGGLDGVHRAVRAADEEARARSAAGDASAGGIGSVAPEQATAAARTRAGGGRERGGDRTDETRPDGTRSAPGGTRVTGAVDDRRAGAAWVQEQPYGDVGPGGVGRTGRAGGMGGGRLDHLPAAASAAHAAHAASAASGTSAGPPDATPSGAAPGGVGHQVDGVHTRRVLLHASGFKQSPYADVRPAGGDTRGSRAMAGAHVVPDAAAPSWPGPGRPDPERPDPGRPEDAGRGARGPADGPLDGYEDHGDVDVLAVPPRKLWHSSPGSSGH